MSNGIEDILKYVKEHRAIDFSAYRPQAIRRRIDRRLMFTGMPDYASYHRFLSENPNEMDGLIDSLTIKVSYFFRDPLVFEILGSYILPELLNAHKDLRIWCAGSARGEEAYSVAILLRELMEDDEAPRDVFLIATDIDKEAIESAGRAEYKDDVLLNVKKSHLDKYFMKKDGSYKLKDEIKTMVTFGLHDVMTCTSPHEGIFSEYHLILCRNLLIYFESVVHEKVLKGLTGFLSHGGFLILGEAETLPSALMHGFDAVLPRLKVFKRSRN